MSVSTHDCFPDSIPSIEVGSFVTLSPDNSEFIGSASGVFFVNTVFRAFARAAAQGPVANDGSATEPSGATPPGSTTSNLDGEKTPVWPPPAADPDSDDLDPDYGLITDYTNSTSTTDEIGASAGHNNNNSNSNSNSNSPSYGVSVPGLGTPPPAHVAGRLLTEYFKLWHHFLPFLHGPTFLGQVQSFYDGTSDALDTRGMICRAVIFQCVFHIADCTSDVPSLEPQSLIRSPAALSNLLGFLASHHDIQSLQALLAVEMYHLTNMSLRAASTVHGMVLRGLYHAGLHRCPCRYIALSARVCNMRKRIFWVAYTLDRTLSLFLGHPLGMSDADVDVCIPGSEELHRLARSPDNPNDDPANDDPDDRSRELVLCCLAKHAQLMGEIIQLLHQSIHGRSITRTKFADLTCRVHEWWNMLPPALQDQPGNPISRLGIMYNHSIVLLNRPFLSLPTDRLDFKLSLQAALAAARNNANLLSPRDGFAKSSPTALSVTWMTGLILSFACLMGYHPLAQAQGEIERVMDVMKAMSVRWMCARRCHVALAELLDTLKARHRQSIPPAPVAPTPLAHHHHHHHPFPQVLDDRAHKKRRVEPDASDDPAAAAVTTALSSFIPVLQYYGPDFGFDTSSLATNPDSMSMSMPYNMMADANAHGFFGEASWDTFMLGLGHDYS